MPKPPPLTCDPGERLIRRHLPDMKVIVDPGIETPCDNFSFMKPR